MPSHKKSIADRTQPDSTAKVKSITITQCAFRKSSGVIRGGEFLQNQDVPSIVEKHGDSTLSIDQVWADDCPSNFIIQKFTQNQGMLESQPNDSVEQSTTNDDVNNFPNNTDTRSFLSLRTSFSAEDASQCRELRYIHVPFV